ncbi:hypothetical protein [Lysinibacillus xylanilyticus]|uniref:hypothetical protein n=1 Tax=Lysinibacillus xylanilyticus TaxID=582475 RepID=UPI00381A34C5
MGNIKQLGDLGDGVYIVQQGAVVEKLEPKEYGQDSILWQREKVFEVSENQRRRIGNSSKKHNNKKIYIIGSSYYFC